MEDSSPSSTTSHEEASSYTTDEEKEEVVSRRDADETNEVDTSVVGEGEALGENKLDENRKGSSGFVNDFDWWDPDLGPAPAFKLVEGVAEYTLSEWMEGLKANQKALKEYKKLLGPEVFVAVQNLNYSVTLRPPFEPAPEDGGWRKTWTSIAGLAQHVTGLPLNLFNKVTMHPVRDITCYFKASEMTLVLGAPGCGKEALFSILANRLHDGKAKGTITYNGKAIKPKDFHHITSYIGSNDTGIHVPNMTVRETLEFSHNCRMPDAELHPWRVNIIMQLLRLDHRADTIVGDAITRGVSGGERRRVTIGVELVKLARVLYLDEPTTGLDASAALAVMRVLKGIAHSGNTVVCAAKQPSFEILSLFDKVMIMTRGQIAFHGTTKQALNWFASLGYYPLERSNPAEFLQEVVESPSRFVRDRDEEGGIGKVHSPEEFVEEFRNSKNYQEMLEEIELQHAKLKELDSSSSEEEEHSVGENKRMVESNEGIEAEIDLSDYLDKQKYPISILDQYWLLQKREFIAWFRAKDAVILNIVEALTLAFLMCTLFFHLDKGMNDTYNRQGVIFFAILAIGFSTFTNIASALEGQVIFKFQRSYKYYQALPYALATSVASLANSMIFTAIFGTLLYWIVGLNSDDADKWVYFMLLGFSLAFCMGQFIRMAALVSPNPLVANVIVPVVMMVMVLFSGFFIPQDHMPYYFIWLYYLSPIHYAIEGAMINEFTQYTIRCKPGDLVPSMDIALQVNSTRVCTQSSGDDILSANAFSTQEWVKWLMLVAVLGWAVIFAVLSYAAVRWVKWKQPGDGYNPPLPSAADIETSVELADFTGKYNKKRKLTKPLSMLRSEKPAINTPGSYFSFKDVTYSIPMGGGVLGSIPLINKCVPRHQLQLLNSISGYVKPGMTLALMGASGAGKSTLLDVIGQRKTYGKIGGEILINGKKVNKYFNRMVGYVEQQDIHAPLQTVREAFEISAICRLPSTISRKDKKKHANQVVKFLGMQHIADTVLIMLPQSDMKLVTLGVELAADPSLLLLDEPTSGLDSKGAYKVMKAVSAVAEQGKSVICTIHQPSEELFRMFSHLLLLKKGGELVYYGPVHSSEDPDGPKDFGKVLEYFEGLGLKCPPRKNPADFVLDVSNGMVEGSEDLDLISAFKGSDMYAQLQKDLDEGILPEGVVTRDHKHSYANNLVVSSLELFKRNVLAYLRFFEYVRINMFVFLGMGLLLGFLFFQSEYDQKGAKARASLLYFCLLLTNLMVFPVMANIIMERAQYYRERASRTYRSVAYIFGLFVADFPFLLTYTLLFSIPIYWLVGFQAEADKFFIFLLIMILGLLINQSFIALIGALAPSLSIAFTLTSIAISAFSLFAGFLIRKDNIPDYWIWAYYLDWTSYALESFLVNEFKGIDLHCNPGEYVDVPLKDGSGGVYKYCPITSGDQFLDTFGYDSSHLWRNIGIMFALYAVFLTITAMVIAWWKHIKR